MRIKREQFLSSLESVLPGTSDADVIEQSSCVIFTGGQMATFNDEVACSIKMPLKIKGAVKAQPLINLLRKIKDVDIDIEIGKGELHIKGKGRRSGIAMENEVLLPVDVITFPKKWLSLPEGFAEATDIVRQCASKDESQLIAACIHLHPDFMEACDNFQACRYTIPTSVRRPVLIKSKSVQHILKLSMVEFGETKEWIHFRNEEGLILSCRRYMSKYPDISSALKITGRKIILPKGLRDAVECAEIFSAENDDDLISVSIADNKMKIKGEGPLGWFSEIKRVKEFKGSLAFKISPKLLIDLLKRYNKCVLSKEKMKITVGKMNYVRVLAEPDK